MNSCHRSWFVHVAIIFSLLGCSPDWAEPPYEVYWIDGAKTLGYSLGGGAFISRVEEPINIASNNKYLSVYACPKNQCAFYYIDKEQDHKYAEFNEFVYGPFSQQQFAIVAEEIGLPPVSAKKDERNEA